MAILAEFDTSVNGREQRTQAPSIKKYGTVITEGGFTQFPRLVEEYLHSLGLCSTAILLVIILSSYRWEPDQEIYPSVRTLAARLKVSTRRLNQLTAQLVELGLLIKIERFSERSQIANIYDLEPLYRRVAAWKSGEVATALAEEEAQADEPFQPENVLEQAAQIISEEFGEPSPRQQRYNATRLVRRWEQHPHIAWESFADLVEKAAEQTEERAKEPTRTGKVFTKLIPYFFSALDYRLSRVQPAPAQKPTTHPQAAQNKDQQPQPRPAHQQPKKSGVLAERAAERKAAEAAGQRKVSAPEELTRRIEATALTYRDRQVKSSVQRAANLMADAQLDQSHMCELVEVARARTSAATNVKNRMSYFFSILEEKVSANVTNRG